MLIRRASALFLLISSIALATPAALATTANSDATTAKVVNLTRADLPVSTKWTAAVQTPNTAAEAALGVKALGCIRASGGVAGKISTDPFGITEEVGGGVTADAQSSDFAEKGSSGVQPSVSSEVVMLKSATQASNDLSAFATSVALTCLSNYLAAGLGVAGTGKVTAATGPPIPRLGTGRGGLDLRFVVTGLGLSGPLVDDSYFYVQGRAEVYLSFLSINTQFSKAWSDAIATHVMARARSVLGS